MSSARLVTRVIDAAALIAEVSGADRGAVTLFLGTVRNSNDGRPVDGIDYTAYDAMAVAEMEQNAHQPFLREEMRAFLFTQLIEPNDEPGLLRALRSLRKRVLLRVAIRDLSGLAALAEVMTAMTALAEETICFALERQEIQRTTTI